ncbi:MAG: hypothetical protein GF331_18995 [Chitinivibrionales bacterium]|nr:hypothetical protein [Chitinivibrionales bacterium]
MRRMLGSYLVGVAAMVTLAQAAENVNRGVVLLPRNGGEVYVGWRLLLDDTPSTGFHVYRSTSAGSGYAKLTASPVAGSTNYVDRTAEEGVTYYYTVTSVNGDAEGAPSSPVSITAAASASYRKSFATVASGGIQRICTGDVNGDGYLDIAILWPNKNKDPYYGGVWSPDKPCSDTYKLSMYLHDGTHLWTYDLGWGIELGIHYSPFALWDIDDDGKAEVLLKTVKSDNPLDYDKEYLTVLDGMTKAVEKETRWLAPPSGFSSTELQKYNNNSRNHVAIAYLDGATPSIIVGRGTYGETKVAAFSPALTKLWESDFAPSTGRSSHGMEVADIDGDGNDEIFWGDITIESDGSTKWTAPRYDGHPDLLFVADIIPSNPGLEVFYGREGWRQVQSTIGNLVLDASGEVLWQDMNHVHVHTGMMGDFSNKSDGMEIYTGQEKNADVPLGPFTYRSDGTIINNNTIDGYPVQWDAGPHKRIYDHGRGNIVNYDSGTKTFIGKATSVGRGPIIADLWGDYREEILAPETSDGNRVVIYTNYHAVDTRRVSLLLDKKYREGLARTGMQYLRQCFAGGYYFHEPAPDTQAPEPTGMTIPEKARIEVVFNEPLDRATAEDAGNYSLNNGATVLSATLVADSRHVVLTTTALTHETEYTLTIRGIADRAANVMPSARQVSATFVQALVESFTCAGAGAYVWSTLATGTDIYTDRDYTYTSVPAAMEGQPVLRTAMDDKNSDAADPDYISFTLTDDATVYVLYTAVNATLETTWLNGAHGWTKETYTVGTTIPGAGEADRTVASRHVSGGSTVNLGGHGATASATSMYTVVVVPGEVTGAKPPRSTAVRSANPVEVTWYDILGRRLARAGNRVGRPRWPGMSVRVDDGVGKKVLSVK